LVHKRQPQASTAVYGNHNACMCLSCRRQTLQLTLVYKQCTCVQCVGKLLSTCFAQQTQWVLSLLGVACRLFVLLASVRVRALLKVGYQCCFAWHDCSAQGGASTCTCPWQTMDTCIHVWASYRGRKQEAVPSTACMLFVCLASGWHVLRVVRRP
jgi:hypothetical protein